MNFDEYSAATSPMARYPNETSKEALTYCMLGLNGEAGEAAEKMKKWLRDGEIDFEGFWKELGDVLWYLNRAAEESGKSLSEIAQMNIDKLESRNKRGVLHGSGDER